MRRFTSFTVLLLPSVLGAFTHTDKACWRRNCVVRTDAGTLCFDPQENGIAAADCTDEFLKNLTKVHLASTVGRSIVYYDDKAHLLGAATWHIPPTMANLVFVCMSGRRTDKPKQYRTICRKAHSDDDMNVAAVHLTECVVDKKPRTMSDGCFNHGANYGDDDKRFWENPVAAGLFWILGSLVTLVAFARWGRKALNKRFSTDTSIDAKGISLPPRTVIRSRVISSTEDV